MALAINGVTVSLQLQVTFNEMSGYWVMGISDQYGNPIVSCVPMGTGAYPAANLLAHVGYLNIGTAYVINSSGISSPDYPGSTELGSDFLLLWDWNQGAPGPQGLPGPPGPVTISSAIPSGIYLIGSSGNLIPYISGYWTQQATLTGDVNILPPLSGSYLPGSTFLVQLIQDSSGGHAVTWDVFYTGLSGFALDTTASTQACLWFQVNQSGTSAQVIQVAQNGNSLT